MQDGVVIEQMRLSERDDVLAFLRSAYGEDSRQAEPDFWDWHFPESPYCDPADLPIWLAKVDDRIAGQMASVPVEFNVGDKTVRAIWILDLIVGEDFRRRGIAKKLALASMEYLPHGLGVNTPQQHAPKMLVGLGWTIFSKIPRYQKVLFPGNAVREISKLAPVRSMVNLAFAPMRRSRKSADVKIVDGFDGSFDELWHEARTQWPCSVSRNSSMLDWQYCRQPRKKFDILALNRDGRLRGYAVMFFRKPNRYGAIEKAAISDICYTPDDADNVIDTLLASAIDLAIERRAGTLVTDVIDARLESRLRRAGFWRVKSDLQVLAKVPEGDLMVYNAAHWYLTRGDSDISIFEAPNL